MEHKEYNGWTNYETWVVNLWMDNEEGSYNYWREQAKQAIEHATPSSWATAEEAATSTLTHVLKEQHEEALPELTGFAADLLNAAMSEVNWYEIAEHLIESAKENA